MCVCVCVCVCVYTHLRSQPNPSTSLRSTGAQSIETQLFLVPDFPEEVGVLGCRLPEPPVNLLLDTDIRTAIYKDSTFRDL